MELFRSLRLVTRVAEMRIYDTLLQRRRQRLDGFISEGAVSRHVMRSCHLLSQISPMPVVWSLPRRAMR